MKRDVRQVAAWAAEHPECPPGVASAARRLLSRPRRVERVVPAVERASERKATKKAERTARISAIREAVFRRANDRCEAYIVHLSASENPRGERCRLQPYILDHWEGGSGRRRANESVETCWALCSDHNLARGANHPSALWWNLSRELHCDANGIPFHPHIARRLDKVNRTRRTA